MVDAEIASVEVSISSKPSVATGQKIHALTSLRFFAALFVVVYHTYWTSAPLTTSARLLTRIASLGFLSVGFFFLLSGYILSMVYLQRGKPVQQKKFFVARFARIYPLYLFTLLLDSPAFLIHLLGQYGHSIGLRKIGFVLGTNVLMLQAWLPSQRGIDNPNWSIFVEALFYLLFPLIGVALWRLKGKWIWFVAAAIWITNQLLVSLVTPHVTPEVLKFNPVLHLGTFAMGILLARWQTQSGDNAYHSRAENLRVFIALLLASVGCLVLLAILPAIPLGNVHDGLMAPVFMLVIWAFSHNRSWAARVLSAKWLVILGEASFGLYLIHILLFHRLDAIMPDRIHTIYPMYLLACIGLSLVSFYWFETPLRRMILSRMKRKLSRHRSSPRTRNSRRYAFAEGSGILALAFL